MKKIFSLILITLLAMSLLVSCGGNQGGGDDGVDDACRDGHTFTTYVSNNDATCTEDGTKTAGCEYCDATDTKLDEGSAKGHSYGAWEVTKIADCTNKGSEKRICSECRTDESRDTDALGHAFNTTVYGYQSAEGHAYKCADCGEHDVIAAHTPGAEATETDAQKCTVCQYVIKAALGHSHAFTVETANEVTFKSAATCTSAATYYKSCSCGAVSETDTFTDGDPLGHDFLAATCEDPKTCKRCPVTEGDPLDHAYGEWYTYKDATASNQGEKRQDCERCDHFKSEVIPAKESNMDPNGWTPVKSQK